MLKHVTLLTYLIVLGIFRLSVVMPFFGYSLRLDSTSLGFAALLMVFAFALILLQNPESIAKLRLGASGLEIERLAKDAKQDALTIPQDVKLEVSEIQLGDTNRNGIFLGLIVEIENKLRLLGNVTDPAQDSWKYRSISQSVSS